MYETLEDTEEQEEQLRFIPPTGPDGEWPDVSDWVDATWAHWLREHNKYGYLKPWAEDDIHQYLTRDRYLYGLGLGRQPGVVDKWFYNPAPVAVPFHASKVPNILFGGAAGGTKSHSARWDAYRHCIAVPGFRALLMRRTFKELKDNHIDKSHSEAQLLDDFLGGKGRIRHIKDDFEVIFDVHGRGQESKVLFGHCQHVGDEESYLGNAYDAFYPDEAATFEKKQIIGVAGRLRSAIRGITARMGATSNPGGAHTLWLRDYFIEKVGDKIRQENPRYKEDRYEFIGAMLYDNPYYMDPDGTYNNYEERLFSYDRERRKQLLMGDWTALSGQFFPEFTARDHVAVIDLPPGCKIERWLDWGYDPHYGICLWVALLPNGRLYVFHEWRYNGEHAKKKLVGAEVASRIKELTANEVLPLARSRRINRTIADPSMWGADGHSGEDYSETFSRKGVPLTQADHDRVMGWGRLRHWLRNAPDGYPWIIFHPRCVTTIRSIPGLIRDKNDPDDLDTTGEDHPADAVRYGVMGRPTPTKMRRASTIILPGTAAEAMAEMNATVTRKFGQVA